MVELFRHNSVLKNIKNVIQVFNLFYKLKTNEALVILPRMLHGMHSELKIEQSKLHRKPKVNLDAPEGYTSCFTSGTRHVALVTNAVVSHEWFFPLYACSKIKLKIKY
jgi:hypothetical protein